MLMFIRIAVPRGEWPAGVRHARRCRGRRRRGEAVAHVAGLRRVAGVGILHAQFARAPRHTRDHRMNTALSWPSALRSAALGCARPPSGLESAPDFRLLVTPNWGLTMNSHCQTDQRYAMCAKIMWFQKMVVGPLNEFRAAIVLR